MHEQIAFGVLGPLAVWQNGETVAPRSPSHQTMLGVLLLAEGRPVTPERLLDLIWGDTPPRSGRAWVQVTVSRLRTWLERNAAASAGIDYDLSGYRLRVEPDTVDLVRFRKLLEAARVVSDDAGRLDLLEQALTLWRGPVLAGDAAVVRSEALANGVNALRLDAACRLADAAIAASQPGRAADQLTELAAEHPLDERLQTRLALLLAGCGRQAEALDTLERCRGRLTAELGVDPGEELREAHLRVLRQQVLPRRSAAGSSAAPRWRGTRRRVSAVIGRGRECTELIERLRRGRLVTVVGPGGCGKTTVASEVAARLEDEFPDGVVFLALAPLTGPAEVLPALGSLLGVAATDPDRVGEGVLRTLAPGRLLLVLDNCEHLVDACADLVRTVLDEAPDTVVLTTSRQPLGVVEERVVPLEPLEVPAEGSPVDPGTASVALFLRRAEEATPGFRATGADLGHVGRLCRRLDGLPLALELAAARVRAIPIRIIAERLDRSLGLLDGVVHGGDPRHRTLQSTIDWSYQLLDQAGRQLLAQLSMFCGSFTVEAAEAVCASPLLPPDRLLPELAGLVDRSLLQSYDVDGEHRYRLLEAVREFAVRHLRPEERDAVQDRHLDYWLSIARSVDALPTDAQRRTEYQRIAADVGNVHAVLEYGHRTGRVVDAAEITARMFDFWTVNPTFLGDGETWLRRAEAAASRCPADINSHVRYWRACMSGVAQDYQTFRDQMAHLLPELAKHRPRPYRNGTISLVTSSRFLLDPAALARLPEMFAAVGNGDSDEPSTALTAAAGVFASWGRYDEAARLCDDYAARAVLRGTSISISQQVLRTEIAIGTGRLHEAEACRRLMAEQLPSAGGPLLREPPRRAMALVQLATGQAGAAAQFLTEAIAEMRASYPRPMCQDSHLLVLLAEARRRTGDLDAARTTLLDGLTRSRLRSHFRVGMTGVVAAALLASDFGETGASRRLTSEWDRLRRRIGLPVPVGFESVAETILGLDPAAPPEPDPGYAWSADPLFDLVDQAQQWCARHPT